MKKISLTLLALVSLTSCNRLSFLKPSVGRRVDDLNYLDYNIDSSCDVFDLLSIVAKSVVKNFSFDYESTFQFADEPTFTVKGSNYSYVKPRDEIGLSQEKFFYRYATITKSFAKFDLYEGGSHYLPIAQRYVANGQPIVASSIFNGGPKKTLQNGFIHYPSLGDGNSTTKAYADHYVACTRFSSNFHIDDLLGYNSNYFANYDYSYSLYENYIVFNLKNPFGLGFHNINQNMENFILEQKDSYFKAELYFNLTTSMIDYCSFDTVTYSMSQFVVGERVKMNATVVNVNLSEVEIQQKIDTVFADNDKISGFGVW